MNDVKNGIPHSPYRAGSQKSTSPFLPLWSLLIPAEGKYNKLETVAGLLYIPVYCIITVTLITYCH